MASIIHFAAYPVKWPCCSADSQGSVRFEQGGPVNPGVYKMMHRISIARPQYKFSCAHMTVFPDGTKERLHGHNYTIAVSIDVDSVDLAAMIPFAPLKTALAELCAAWRERVLLARQNPYLEIIRDDSELELRLCGERYVMPRGDALLLPIDNISVEALAKHVAEQLRDLAAIDLPNVRSIAVTIEESPGQGATCELPLL